MNDDFGKYESMKISGASPALVFQEAIRDNIDPITRIRLIRTVFHLTLGEAKQIADQAHGEASSLEEYRVRLAQAIVDELSVRERNEKAES